MDVHHLYTAYGWYMFLYKYVSKRKTLEVSEKNDYVSVSTTSSFYKSYNNHYQAPQFPLQLQMHYTTPYTNTDTVKMYIFRLISTVCGS